MKRTIFFIGTMFSVFLYGMEAADSGMEHPWMLKNVVVLHHALKDKPATEAIFCAGLAADKLPPLRLTQKEYIQDLLENYNTAMSASELSRTRCRSFHSGEREIFAQYLPAPHIMIFSPEFLSSQDVVSSHVQAFSIISNLQTYRYSIQHPERNQKHERARADKIAITTMRCAPCIRKVCEHVMITQDCQGLSKGGHLIQNPSKVERIIHDARLESARCQSCFDADCPKSAFRLK